MHNKWLQAASQLVTDEAGQDVVEYGLLIATIAVVVLIGIAIVRQSD